MKHLVKLLSLGAALIASAPFALAVPITGAVTISAPGDTFNSTGFTAPAPVAGTYANAGITAASGTFTTYASCGANCNILTPGLALVNSFTFASTNPIIFYVGNPSSSYIRFMVNGGVTVISNTGTFLNVTGSGTFTDTAGDTPTIGTFNLTSTTNGNTSFTIDSSVAATPEPSSLIMLGTGLMSAAGMLVRRRKIS